MKTEQEIIIETLVRRDGIDSAEAVELLEEFETEANALLVDLADENPFQALEALTEITRDCLGLEPDYTEYLIYNF